MTTEIEILARVTAQQLEDFRHYHEREHVLLQVAADAAKVATDLRLDHLNELRADVEQDRSEFADADSAELIRTRIEERLGILERGMAAQQSATVTWSAAIAVFFTLVQIALRFIS